MSAKSAKPKSPPTPSRSLGDAVSDVKKLYDQYSHGKFAKSEIASTLGVSASSGPFAARLFTLKTFGLVVQSGADFSVSESFMVLNSTDAKDPKFKATALSAVRRSDVFRELLEDFKSKLPSAETVATRLENQKRFNRDRAEKAAAILEKSLHYAGVLDGANNLLPIRESRSETPLSGDERREKDQKDEDSDPEFSGTTLGMEIPVGENRKVVVRYPQDLSPEEAKKVGAVLSAVVA